MRTELLKTVEYLRVRPSQAVPEILGLLQVVELPAQHLLRL